MIALAWRHRSALLRVMIAYVVVFLAYLPWIEVIAKTLRRNTFWIKSPSGIPTSFLSYFTELFNRSPTITLFAAAAIIILLFWGIYDIVTSKTSPRAAKTLSPGLLLIAWFLIPFLGAWIISKTMIPVLTNRNLVISLPAAYLLVSRSLVRISARLKLKFLIMLIIAAALLYHLVFIRHYYSAPHHRQYSKAADYIMLCDQQLKKSIIITHVPKFILNGYFFRKSFVKKEIFDPTNAQPYLRDTLVLPEQEQVSHVWYISGGARAHEKESIDRDALVFLEQHFKLIGKKNFFLTTAWLYKKKDTTEGKHSPREGIAH